LDKTRRAFRNYAWFEAKYIKFKPGGNWDHIAYLHLKDGPKQLSFENPEIESKWWNAVVELAGSEQKAKEIIDGYNNCILNEKHNPVRMRICRTR
jgi:hypothetical protein